MRLYTAEAIEKATDSDRIIGIDLERSGRMW